MRPGALVFSIFLLATSAWSQTAGFPDNFHPQYFSFPPVQEGIDCLPHTVIFKLRPEQRQCLAPGHDNALRRYLDHTGILSLERKFPLHKAPEQPFNSIGQPLTDLSLIYELRYTADIPVLRVVNEINATGMVLYAQPHYIEQHLEDPLRPAWTPNDTSISLQWYLTKIRAIDAWDTDTGSASVIIAVVDGGTNFSHPDLGQNVYNNMADTIDGLDNDNDGYIDNYRGWDMGDNDNNPQFIGAFNSAHGTSMCGLAAGSSNNVSAIAGVSYKCKYMPVKMVHSSFGWIAGYEGIVYAADHGAQVISCSWGGTTPQPYGQDVIRYAVVNKGKQVIAAAGNSNNTVPFYPASYEGVIAVGGTDINDLKSGNSSYYEFVDLVSPGQLIYEPYFNGYSYGFGTSEACAIASGSFGLVQSQFPGYTPHQVGALLIQTAYRTDTIPGNAAYVNKQGSGRIDLYNAFNATQRPFIYFYQRTYTDAADDIILVGDTVTLTGNYINYLAGSTGALKGTLYTSTAFVQITDSVTTLGSMSTLGMHTQYADGFRFVVQPSCPFNQDILFKLVFDDGGRLNTQYFVITVNPQFYNLTTNGLHTTVTHTGKLGFFNNLSTQGVGYRLKGGDNQLLGVYFHPMGFWLGQGGWTSNQTLGSPLGACCPYTNQDHFTPVSPIQHVMQPLLADAEVISHYNDDGAGVSKLNIEVVQKAYAWNTTVADSNYILLEYELKNNNATGLSDVFAGIFSDMDMPDSLYGQTSNLAEYDTLYTMGVMHNPGGRVYTGIKVVSGQPVSYYAINSDGSGGSIGLYDGFTNAEKWNISSGGILRPLSGLTDIAQYIGVRIDSIAPGGCATVVMALTIAPDLNDLHTVANAVQLRYNNLYNTWTGNGGDTNWHNPANWSKGTVPTYADYVVIPDTRGSSQFNPVVSVADAEAGNLDVRCGGDLQIINNRKLHVGQ